MPCQKHILFKKIIKRLENNKKTLQASYNRISLARIGTFLIAILLFLLYSHVKNIFFAGLGAIFLVLFTILLIIHSKLKIKIVRLTHWIAIKKSNRARVTLDWKNIPENNQGSLPNHPFAHDLDIIGNYSLYRLLDITFSSKGKKYLLNWLLYPDNNLSELYKRHNLVQELKPLSLFRDKLLLESSFLAQSTLNADTLLAHLREPVPHSLYKVLVMQIVLLFLTYSLFLGQLFFGIQPFWIITWLVYFLISLYFAFISAHLFNRALSIQIGMKRLKAIFSHIERRSFTGKEHLASLCDVFSHKSIRPSLYLKKITYICDALSIRAHFLVHLGINIVFPWDSVFSCLFEKVRSQLLTTLPVWLDRLGILEAASSLANFAYCNPHYALPEIFAHDNSTHEFYFKAEKIGHPLIPPTKRVANDFIITKSAPLAIITGSNMSGKSTFLRTIGINMVLAQAGAPICASMYQAAWFMINSCIRIEDSLTENVSYFYAEVKKLKFILDQVKKAKPYHLFALIDEIFKGTNNRERLIGSRFYIEALAAANCLALVTTHDLELTQIEKEIDGIKNYHFQETIKDNKMSFDFIICTGPATSTNALRIMNSEGLPIPHSFLRS
ncbi:MAG: MutS-related protein [bacterium]